MRVLHPETVFGAISSSGVTAALIDYWEYLDTIRNALEPNCSSNVVGSTKTIDEYLDQGEEGTKQIKTLFGLQDLSDSADFGSTVGWNAYGVGRSSCLGVRLFMIILGLARQELGSRSRRHLCR